MSTSDNLEVDEREGDAVTARVWGDLDIVTSEAVKRQLAGLFDTGPVTLVLDMGEVRFVDSSGLGALVAIHRSAEAAAGQFTVRAVPPQVQRLFEITRLGDLLSVEPD